MPAFEMGGNATRLVIAQLGMGELLGWSWLIPPYQWAFGAVTMGPVQAFEFDGPAVRSLCGADPRLARDLDRRVLHVVTHRLRATRLRLVTGSAAARPA